MNELPCEQSVSGNSIQMMTILNHLRNPQNLLTYMVFTMWCKLMGVSQYIPTVTVG